MLHRSLTCHLQFKWKASKNVIVNVVTIMMSFGEITWLQRHTNSHRRCSIKTAVLKNVAIFTGRHLCWSLFLKKLQTSRSATLLKRDSNTGVFL